MENLFKLNPDFSKTDSELESDNFQEQEDEFEQNNEDSYSNEDDLNESQIKRLKTKKLKNETKSKSKSKPKTKSKSKNKTKKTRDTSSKKKKSENRTKSKKNDEDRLKTNREAAQAFRQRQKQLIDDLEEKVEKLENENAEYRTRTEALEAERRVLASQLEYFQTFMTRAMSLAYRNSPTGPKGPDDFKKI
ncbi:basic-leucine zipper transcription factor f-related [Anaeramoeba ignava]|uniref:Basic-leucine zipper transcription factor f-related n=1 Tax=Anaeramoeba ignava TaxID=1746090 RepID=A0A9Q0R9R2_ANAIG|nr:basic-leucine zipper transcription factor f-related [Anaeramoeba ignava]